MRTARWTILLILAAVIIALPAAIFAGATATATNTKPAAQNISGTRTASCLLKVTVEPSVLPMSLETCDYLMHSSGVLGKAVRDILGMRLDGILEGALIITPLSSGPPSLLPMSLPSTRSVPPSMPVPAAPSSPAVETLLPSSGTEESGESVSQPAPATPARRPIATSPRSTTARTTATRPPVEPTRRPVSPSDIYGVSYGGGYGPYSVPGVQPSTAPGLGQMMPLSEQTLVFLLEVRLPDSVTPVAQELMRAVVGNFANALDGAFNDLRQRLDAQLNMAAEESARAEKELEAMQKQQREISDSRYLSRLQLQDELGNARVQIEGIQMDQASNDARWDSISKQIAETEARLKEQLAKDSVSKELTEIMEINTKQLSQVETLVQQGRASPVELEQAKEKLARARIDLAQRQEQLSKQALAKIDTYNRDLATRSLEKTQNDSRIAQFKDRMRQASQLLAAADQFEILSLKADVVKQNLQEMIRLRDQMERRNRMVLPPSVTVIGAE